MKKGIFVFFFCGVVSFCFAQENLEGRNDFFNFDRETSYAIGMYLASQFDIPDVRYDYQSIMEGFRAYTEMLERRFSMDDAIMKIQTAFENYDNWYMSRLYGDSWSDVDLEKNREDGIAFLAENARRPGVITLASGLQYEVVWEGGGDRPSATDLVQVHYEGTLINGTIFDSSYERGEPIVFPLAEVIQGWTEGLQLMREGSIFILYIPYDLGYGSMTNGPIPGYSVTIFRVEFLSVIR